MRNILKKKTQIDELLAAAGITSGSNLGPVAAGVSSGAGGGMVQRVLTFKNVVIPLVDNAGVDAHGALKFYTFDKGQINIVGAVVDLVVTKSSTGVNATWNGDFGVGTVAADGTNTLSSTEQNVVPTTSMGPAVAGVSAAAGSLASAALFDGSATAVDLYLNVLVDDADQDVTTTPCNLIFNGTVTLTFANNGII